MSDAFILGAGFSKAVSPQMPTMAELGEDVLRSLGPDKPRFPASIADSSFEDWLTYLSGDQPWMKEDELLRNRGSYLRIAREICEIVRRHEAAVRAADLPDWLRSLTAYWHENRSTVITFNYDTLVEAAYTETVRVRTNLKSPDNYVYMSQILHAPVTPLGTRLGGVLTASDIDTFTLVKLHGCHSWLYSGRESFWGEAIYHAYGSPGWGSSLEYAMPRLGDDKSPLVVPPAAGKSSFFQNETVRGEWAVARNLLEAADAVWIAGYSLPDGDQLARQLLQAGLRPGQTVHVVNPDAEVTARLEGALPSASVLPTVVQADPLEALAARLVPTTLEPVFLLPGYS